MYLHIGQNKIIRIKDIIGIFDLDSNTTAGMTKAYLKQAQQENHVVSVSLELPKSFIVCRTGRAEQIYLSQLSAGTLRKRQKNGIAEDPF